ncbi:hypothetical protein PR202_ga28396 [Eleusine coracana subsp. coracana]|uniref:Uncharacterized protein n=1 Tax=Eleusine coracana subsp. coracana TaxID=191504 RepID=A0AAV5DJ27_ELECO|nr:hypothetical protein PR202_ga28396 [Eleusine coracana subsp. coracana]
MDFYSDDSDPDLDADLQEDLDALRRSCILSGADPDAAVAQLSSGAGASAYLTGPSTPAVSASAAAPAAHDFSDDDEEDEDLALVRSIRESLRLTRASPPPDAGDGGAQPRPICVWPPSDTDDDDENDLETLRAIQRRFSHYQSGTSTSSTDNLKPEAPLGARSSECFVNEPEEDLTVQKESVKDGSRTGFPQAALLLVDALKKNRACQKLIRRKMVNIEAKIEENKDLRDRVKCLMGYQLSCRKSVGKLLCQKEDPRVRLISSRKPTAQGAKNKYKKMPALFLGPAENLHVSKYKMVLKQFPMSLQKQPWLDAEKDKLARGIKQQYQETLILNSMNNGSAVDMAYALTNSASNFDVTPESLRSVLPLINWDKIAAMYLPGRSGAECESRWRKTLNPEKTGVGRWSLEEDKCLMVAVKLFGSGSWSRIAQFVPGRMQSQCRERWCDVLDPDLDHREWQPEEDSKLLAAVDELGPVWSKIARKIIPRRSDNMCMRGGSKKQMEDAVAVSDGLNNSSKGHKRSRKKKSTPDNNVTVQNITMGSIPVDNEAVPTELRGIISTDIGTEENRTREAVSPGEERVVKKRKRASKSVANDGAVRKRMRGSITVDSMMDPVSVGEAGVAKKRRRRTNSSSNEVFVRKRRGSTTSGEENTERTKMRCSVSVESNGAVTRRKRAPARMSAEDSSISDDITIAIPELGLPSVPSEERAIDDENLNKGKRKSTPRTVLSKLEAHQAPFLVFATAINRGSQKSRSSLQKT